MTNKKPFTIDTDELKKFIDENQILVPILMTPYQHKVVIAEDVIVKIQKISNLTETEFQEYINEIGKINSVYIRNDIVDNCISNIEYPGMFKVHGYEKIGNRPYIFVHKIYNNK